MESELIYHITTFAWWSKQSAADSYATETLAEEGFIHCSTSEQVKDTLERYYANQKGLLLLHIDPTLLKAELKYEVSTNGQLFPHVFGKINREAIVKVEEVSL
jgi:uncharacterized protein (DUF952 family)